MLLIIRWGFKFLFKTKKEPKLDYGSACTSSNQCQNTTECSIPTGSTNGICQCGSGYYRSFNLNQCGMLLILLFIHPIIFFS